MVRQIKMPLESGELQALSQAAEDDLRSVGNQARYLVSSALKDRGLLDKNGLDSEDPEEKELNG